MTCEAGKQWTCDRCGEQAFLAGDAILPNGWERFVLTSVGCSAGENGKTMCVMCSLRLHAAWGDKAR